MWKKRFPLVPVNVEAVHVNGWLDHVNSPTLHVNVWLSHVNCDLVHVNGQTC